MTTRQLSLKRSVYDFKKEGMKNVILMNRDLLACVEDYKGIMNSIEEDTPSDIKLEKYCIIFVTLTVQHVRGRYFIGSQYQYTFLTKEFLPEMWRSRKEIELKRQRKLENLANLLDNGERYQEAHAIRIIIKPHLERMNRKWTNTALKKLKSLLL